MVVVVADLKSNVNASKRKTRNGCVLQKEDIGHIEVCCIQNQNF